MARNITYRHSRLAPVPGLAVACLGDAHHDVALFLISALSKADRRNHEQELLRTYLAARRDDAVSFDEAWLAYRQNALYGCVYALTPNEMQPAAIRSAMAERFTQASVDFDTLTLLNARS